MSTKKAKPTELLSKPDLAEEEGTSLIAQLPNPKMARFVHLYLTGQYSYNKIAQLLDVHPNTILGWAKRADVKSVISEMQESTHEIVAQQLKSLTIQASDRLRELMNSPIDGVALQAVKDVLDRAGHKTKQEIKIDKTVTTVEQKWKELMDTTLDAEFEVVDDE
jgi:transposase-like protein